MLEEKGDRELFFARRQLSIRQLSPTNVEQEFQKVLADRTYNPQFTYMPDGRTARVIGQLQSLGFNRTKLGKLMATRRDELMQFGRILQTIGTRQFPKQSEALYRSPSQQIIKRAAELIAIEDHDGSIRHTPASSIKKFLDGFLHYGLRWNVKLKEMIPSASFSIAARTLFINRNKIFSEADVQRLMVHEIGTHIMRAEQGRGQQLRMFVYGFPNYLTTEEGLAVYNEEKAGLLAPATVKHYAGRVIAIHLAKKNSFSTVYTALLEHFKPRDAFMLALRAKRGLMDTSQPGAFTKDHIYLTGYFLVKEFVKKGGNIHLLYTGKVGLDHLDIVKQLVHGRLS